jgi:hypothetical protein
MKQKNGWMPELTIREIALAARVDERTLKKYLSGRGRMRAMAEDRIVEALRARGFDRMVRRSAVE